MCIYREKIIFIQVQKKMMGEKDKFQMEREAIATHDGKPFSLYQHIFMTTKNPWEQWGIITYYNL